MPRRFASFADRNTLKGVSIKVFFKFFKHFKISKAIWAFIILAGLFIALATNMASWLMGFIMDKFFNSAKFDPSTFEYKEYIILIVTLLLVYIMQKILIAFQRYALGKIIVKLGSDLRLQAYRKIQAMEMSFYDDEKTGDLMSALTNDMQNITMAMETSITLGLTAIYNFIIIFFLMFLYAPILGAIALVLIPLSAVIIFTMVLKNQKYYIKQQDQLGKFTGYLEEMIDALPLVNMHQQKDAIAQEFDKYNRDLTKPEMQAKNRMNFTWPVHHLIRNINLLIIVGLGAFFNMKGIPSYGIKPLTFGTITAFSMYIYSASENIMDLLDVINNIQQGIGSIVRIEKILALTLAIDESKLNELIYKQGEIEFKNVCFAYPNKPEKEVLHNISFKIPSGKSLALVGKTGCGKTTIAKLLSKFYLPTSGDILIDGQSIFNIKQQSWRDHIDTILQETYIFKDTVENNLKCIKDGLTLEDVKRVAAQASSNTFIEKLDKQYDTILDNNGDNLSGGQKQLIAITRALLSGSQITILDEATSDIDTMSELQVQKAMKIVMANRTMLMIAHRLSTIKNADHIILIDNGRIIEEGTHKSLMAKKSRYATLYEHGFDE